MVEYQPGSKDDENDDLDEEELDQQIREIKLSIEVETVRGHYANTLRSREKLAKLKTAQNKIDAKYKPFPIMGDIQVKTSDFFTQGTYSLVLDRSLVRRLLNLRSLAVRHGLSDIREFNDQSICWYEANTEPPRELAKHGDDLPELKGLPVECIELSVIGKHSFVFTACLKNVNDSIETQAIYFEHPLFAEILNHFNLDLPALPEKECP